MVQRSLVSRRTWAEFHDTGGQLRYAPMPTRYSLSGTDMYLPTPCYYGTNPHAAVLTPHYPVLTQRTRVFLRHATVLNRTHPVLTPCYYGSRARW